MRTGKPFTHIPAAWALVAVLFAVSATPSLGSLECGATRWTQDSYRAAVQVYAAARNWSRIARWWIDPAVMPPVERASAPSGRVFIATLR